MKSYFADQKDLEALKSWTSHAPEFQKNLLQYMDRDDTAILIMKKQDKWAGIALLKVRVTQKAGTIWLLLNEEKESETHQQIMQESLKWLKQKGAKEFHLI